MSVAITIEHAKKKYGENTIIPDLSLNVKEGELFTLLGPSGCGKTTLLRMIAGFNTIEGGDFYFNDKRINDIDPGKRNIGMVFQNYAIFPNMSVRDNVAFGLKNRKVPKAEIKERTDRFMNIVQISEYADRMPDKLSGGQQQRVALARALVIEPDVLLMDEPLSNLDAKLRVEMRTVIKQIQHEVGITTIYVTHDQEEAMAISDHIAVMRDGVIQHVGTPKGIYQRPKNSFVATFIGRSNLLKAKLSIRGNECDLVFPGGYYVSVESIQDQYRIDSDVNVSIRPEEFTICGAEEKGLHGVVTDSVFLGMNTHYFITLDSKDDIEVIQESTVDSIIPPGSEVCLNLKKDKINIFTEDGSCNIMKPIADGSGS